MLPLVYSFPRNQKRWSRDLLSNPLNQISSLSLDFGGLRWSGEQTDPSYFVLKFKDWTSSRPHHPAILKFCPSKLSVVLINPLPIISNEQLAVSLKKYDHSFKNVTREISFISIYTQWLIDCFTKYNLLSHKKQLLNLFLVYRGGISYRPSLTFPVLNLSWYIVASLLFNRYLYTTRQLLEDISAMELKMDCLPGPLARPGLPYGGSIASVHAAENPGLWEPVRRYFDPPSGKKVAFYLGGLGKMATEPCKFNCTLQL